MVPQILTAHIREMPHFPHSRLYDLTATDRMGGLPPYDKFRSISAAALVVDSASMGPDAAGAACSSFLA